MAIFTPGPLISAIRGKVGGNVFSANANSPYVKSWAYPSVPKTAPQLAVRERITQIHAAWIALSGAQRTAWNNAAAAANRQRTNPLGESYNLTGYQNFTSASLIAIQESRALPTNAVTVNQPAQPSGLTATAELPSTLELEWTSPNYNEFQRLAIFAAVSGFTQRQAPPNRWRWLATYNDADANVPIDVHAEYEAAFGSMIENSTIWIRTRCYIVNGGYPNDFGPFTPAIVQPAP